MTNSFHVVIPARFQSTRLPGKLLMDIAGKTVLERVYHQVLLAQPTSIIIATDNLDIASHAQSFGATVMMTDSQHPTGTDRVAEVISKHNYDADAVIVNVQGDEPFIAPALINQVAQLVQYGSTPVATLCWPLTQTEQLNNPNVVKVVRDRFNNALYFSRSAIPNHRDNPGSISHVFRHIGLYAYRASFLLDIVGLSPCALENCEALEQLRVLWAGFKIRVDVACKPPQQDINTIMDLQRARLSVLS